MTHAKAIRMPGKERPAASRLVIQKPPTTEPHPRNLGRNTKPSVDHIKAKSQRVSITDSFGASPALSALDHSARRDPAERVQHYHAIKGSEHQRATPRLAKLHVGKVKQITSSATLYGRF